MKLSRAASAEDYRQLARRRLPRLIFDYVDGGAIAERTLNQNITDLATVQLRQRVLRDVSSINTTINLFGQPLSMPMMLAPIGFAGMLARRGEIQAARAANTAGIPFILSTVGICSAREVASSGGTPPWFQLYMIRDRGFMRDLLAQVKAAGCPVLVLTVDLAVPGIRYADIRSGMASAPDAMSRVRQIFDALRKPGWLRDVYLGGRPHSFGNLAGAVNGGDRIPDMWEWIRCNFDPSVTWADIDFIREHWTGPLVIKGILDEEDARTAACTGADALIVSNHGGRQLDSAPSTISVLPAIVDAVGDRLPILMDGGIRSGVDMLKALSLGARACLIGRLWAYALAAGGETGVSQLLTRLRDELKNAMELTSCAAPADAATARFEDRPIPLRSR